MDTIFNEIEKQFGYPVEALIMFREFCSINEIAQKRGIKVFYYDAGIFRAPVYLNTVYLDTTGFFANCGIEQRFSNFYNQKNLLEDENILSPKEILTIMLEPEHKDKIRLLDTQPKYPCGIAMQSNIVDLFCPDSHTGNSDLIVKAMKTFSKENILMRNVPGLSENTFGVHLDDSTYACEFIAKCGYIITRASSVSYEALLYGRQMYCMEKGPYQFKGLQDFPPANNQIEIDNLFVAFVALAFYIPRELLYDTEYLRWRMSNPSEIEIYKRNLLYYLTCRGISPEVLSSPKNIRYVELLKAQGFDCFGCRSHELYKKKEFVLQQLLRCSGKSEYGIEERACINCLIGWFNSICCDIENANQKAREYGQKVSEYSKKVSEYSQEIVLYRNQIEDLYSSKSYRIGRIITYVPRKIRRGIRCLIENGLKYTIHQIFH